MQSSIGERTTAEAAMRVRQNVAPAAIGTAFLVYFGFFAVAEPVGTDLYHRAALVFYHTLRLGGLAMGAMALWSMLGRPITLAVDAVLTVLIGVLLILTGLAMAVDGGAMIQTMINVVCGGMFISSGVRNWRDYRFFSATRSPNGPAIPTSDHAEFDRRPDASPDDRRKPLPLPPGSDEPTKSRTSRPRREGPGESEGRGEGRVQRESTTVNAPPPEGFLASLAKKPPPPSDEGQPR